MMTMMRMMNMTCARTVMMDDDEDVDGATRKKVMAMMVFMQL